MISFDGYETLVAASMVLVVGGLLVSRVKWLKYYSIPEPVVGGVIAALGLFVLQSSTGIGIQFDKALSTPLMLCFFASIGLNAEIASLRRGGKPLAKLVMVVVAFLFVQNFVGVSMAKMLGLDPLIGLVAGSITLTGGHGTGAAWGALFSEKYGLASATELAMACATFGLVSGGLIGGPVARFVSRRIRQRKGEQIDVLESTFEDPMRVREINVPAMIETLALFSICLLVGTRISTALHGSLLELPTFLCVLFVGVVLRNVLAWLGWYQVFDRCVSVLGNVALALFLAMAMMAIQLGQMASVAVPLLLILGVQTVAMAAWAIFVTFRVMGGNHDAMVIAAGHCGFGMGATPTAIANMQSVTDNTKPSHLAFLVVPMVGAFFVDLANAVVLKTFVAFLT
jgi:ESS family glutamate:Na+ symporter